MKRKPYTVQEKEELLKSVAIEKISNSSVTYKKEFKAYAVIEYVGGRTPKEIFLDVDVNIELLGKEQPRKCISRWLKIYRQYGEQGLLQENRGLGSKGRPRKKPLSVEEENQRLKQENEILKEKVEYLKKLRGWV
jgi:transposase-like protein